MADLSDWTLIFDLDGTLVESAPDLHAALNHTLAYKGLEPVALSDIRMMIGDGAKALIRKGIRHNQRDVDESEVDSVLWPIFIDHYLANITRLSHLFEGTRSALETLKSNGARLAVCTNKAQVLALEVLKGLDVLHHFETVVGGDITVNKKPSGDHILETLALAGGKRGHAIMIGDSTTDERAARDAKLPYIFVTFGYGVLEGKPGSDCVVIDHWQDMEAAVRQLTPTN